MTESQKLERLKVLSGETAHSENGISRSYESATVPDSMLKHITPHASVLGGKSQ